MDNAVLDIKSGAFDCNTVLKRTISQMTASGIRYIDYDSGRRDRVNVAARRAVLTGFLDQGTGEKSMSVWQQILAQICTR